MRKGNSFLKYMLVECVQIHMRLEPHSEISEAYRRISLRSGSNKAKIAAARHLLRMIYYMLKRRMEYAVMTDGTGAEKIHAAMQPNLD